MIKLIYPAFFKECSGNSYMVEIPDLGIKRYISSGGIYHAMERITQEACALLIKLMDSGAEIPNSTEIGKIEMQEDKGFLSYVVLDVDTFAKRYCTKSVKKTLTIPSWLNSMAEDKKVNFSRILQNALKEELVQRVPPEMPYHPWD